MAAEKKLTKFQRSIIPTLLEQCQTFADKTTFLQPPPSLANHGMVFNLESIKRKTEETDELPGDKPSLGLLIRFAMGTPEMCFKTNSCLLKEVCVWLFAFLASISYLQTSYKNFTNSVCVLFTRILTLYHICPLSFFPYIWQCTHVSFFP